MSRTDAHAPVPVRIARGDLSAVPSHARGHDVCDLPPRREIARDPEQASGCVWKFFYTGVHECSCLNCHGGGLARARNRVERHRDHAELGTALHAWRGGDRDAFDALVAPGRRLR